MTRRPTRPAAPGLPTPAQILAFIADSSTPVGKREIAKHFALRGHDKIALKALLKDMTDEGLVDLAPGRAFHKAGGVPRVTVLRVVAIDGDRPLAVPDRWEAAGPPPQLRVIEQGRRGALTIGDRILARTEEAGNGWIAHPMKRLAATAERAMGVLVEERGANGQPLWFLRPVDKRERRDWAVAEANGAKPGDLVLAELKGRGPGIRAHVVDRLGDPFAPRALSLIAISKHGIPDQFGSDTLAEAQAATRLPLTTTGREDLRAVPIVAIDPVDARDHDDAVWAAPDDDPANAGGFKAVVAIADVSYYVRPGGALDREARRRGNSVYFPDRVVPMLPEELSAGVCSLKADEDRAALVAHLTIDAKGRVTAWRFARALVRLRANIPYEVAQSAIDGVERILPGPPRDPLSAEVVGELRALWAAWALLAKARDARGPLDLDLPERQVRLDEAGRIAEIKVRERLDAHRVIEDFMIAANVAAAKALEAKKSPVMYRIHEPPSREKLVALKEYLSTFGQSFALGQVITPALFNRLIAGFTDDALRPQLMEAVLRSQTQAYYSPANAGHFGLSLGSYAHFTSPIRRYADLLVHRALVDAYGVETGDAAGGLPPRTGLGKDDAKAMARIGEAISALERRAMEAERETLDRYVAAYLSEHVGEVVRARITGVQPFGFFATVDGLGGDGLLPVSMLGAERFRYDDGARVLEGERTGTRYAVGDKLDLRLVEANPISGGLRFELPEGVEPRDARGPRGPRDRVTTMQRGRPANIRHQGRKRR